MLNVLIVDDDLNFCKSIINDLTANKNLRICKVCTNGKEALEILIKEDIDIILLDVVMPLCNGIEVLNNLRMQNNEKYKNSIIVISGEITALPQMVDNPLIYDYVLKGTSNDKITKKVNNLVDSKDIIVQKSKIIHELEKIGYDKNYKGTIYLSETILQIYIHKEMMEDNLQKDIYPIVAKIYNKTVHNIKCNITNATEQMYCNCDINVLMKYFNFYEDTKPTTKTVINTVVNKIS